MRWLTIEQMLRIHDAVLNATPGARGVRDLVLLESAMLRPLTSMGGVELYPGLPTKVAVLLESIVQYHPFVDGNKRTAVVAACTVLELNGLRLVASQEEVEDLAVSVTNHTMRLADIIPWVARHVGA